MALTKVRSGQILGYGSYAPFFKGIDKQSILPNTTTVVTVTGAFFTPNMTYSVSGSNSISQFEFISDNQIKISITTGDSEGNFNLTLSNGQSKTFVGVIPVILGDVFIPLSTDWINVVEPVQTLDGAVKVEQNLIEGSAEWSKRFNTAKDIELRFTTADSPIVASGDQGSFHTFLQVINATDNSVLFNVRSYINRYLVLTNGVNSALGNTVHLGPYHDVKASYVGGIWKWYYGDTLWYTSNSVPPNQITDSVYIKIFAKQLDVTNIKYVELLT